MKKLENPCGEIKIRQGTQIRVGQGMVAQYVSFFTDAAGQRRLVFYEISVYEEGNGYYCVDLPLPDAIITDIKDDLTAEDPDLTFALNFAFPDNMSQEYIDELFAVYGDWNTDYVLTISGLSTGSVTFNGDESADGYLAGQYDAWSEYWVVR